MSNEFLDAFLTNFLVFVLVLTRIGALIMTAPMFASPSIPIRVRALLAIGISAMTTATLWDTPLELPVNLLQLLVLLASEAVLGLALGLGIVALFSGLQLTGQVLGQMSGMQLADAFDPTFNASVPLFSQFLNLMMVTVFIIIGGHRQLLSALLDTFREMPPGQAGLQLNVAHALLQIVSASFVLGMRAAAPVMVALLVSILILGLISRTLPQLNVIAIGFSLNSMMMLAVLCISLGGAVWIFQGQFEPTIELLREALQAD